MDWNYGDILDAVARVVPSGRPALIWRDQEVGWPEFDRRTNNLAGRLVALGLEPGDRAAILCGNHPAYLETLVAEAKARVLNVNINYRYTADEIAYVIDDCEASAFFYQDSFAGMAASLRPRLKSVRLWVRIESARAARAPPPGAQSFEALAAMGDGRPLDIRRSADDGYLLYTGGTTGRPKGVLWRASQSRATQLESPLIPRAPTTMAEHLDLVRANREPSRTIPACPLMHGAGSNAAMADLLGGGTAIILPSERFDADELWAEVERTRATRIAIVGDVFAKPMLRALETGRRIYDTASVRLVTSSGLTWSREVKEGLLRHMPAARMVDILGASEASGFGYAVATAGHAPPTGLFDAGPWTVLIDPDTGEVLPRDRPGEGFLARTGAMATEYYRDPVKTAETYRTIDGRRHAVPGDMARWIPPDRFVLIGRGNLAINTGGEKVFPEEVEEALKLQPGVEDALVVGLPDARWGRIVVALVKIDDRFDESAALTGLGRSLARYKLPRRIIRVEAVPRHESGKPDYRRAQALVAEEAAAAP